MGNFELLENIDFAKADPKGMMKHIKSFPELFEDAYKIASEFSLPAYYIKPKKIVLTGMGGSGESAEAIKALLTENTDLSVEIVHNYMLPGSVDKDTLVIATSYSGNTEETLASFISAYEKGAKMIAICSGGKLQILAEKYKAPTFVIPYQSPPRAAFPYLFTFLVMIFVKLGYIEFSEEKAKKIKQILSNALEKFAPTSSVFGNPAKILAEKIYGKVPVIYATEKLIGVAERMKSQFNENSKNFSYFEEFPELNHKSLEGIFSPKDNIFIIMLESNFEYDRNQLRENITSDILSKNKVSFERVKFLEATDRFSEIFLMCMFGDFVSYYLAILNKVNPGINNVVDYLKEKLG
jgi:glucose/mannose-6-phosphate isomerase